MLILHLIVILALLLHLCILLDFICYVAGVLVRIKTLCLSMWIDLDPIFGIIVCSIVTCGIVYLKLLHKFGHN
ncbi:unnamed protein product [Heligmosomoides polygyrus]|uniref:Ovule protein n=1 Tax=Heligmosomoides polygyrus TaxID=6339 RepID=A0A183FFN8_HELPZ|nr:unnamed protein product [Heligmosomoides polygyrus]